MFVAVVFMFLVRNNKSLFEKQKSKPKMLMTFFMLKDNDHDDDYRLNKAVTFTLF